MQSRDAATGREIATDKLWVNDERTILVRLWASGTIEVATRPDPSATWRPPVYLTNVVVTFK